MTSAARPTFLPAVGGHSLRDTGAGPVTYVSAKDLKAHTKLKFRKDQTTDDRLSLKQKLYEKEQEYLQKVTAKQSFTSQIPNELKMLDIASDSDFSEEDDSDEEEELMRELEKIKRERLEEKEKIEQEKLEEERKEMEERAITGNPLLNDEFAQEVKSFGLKRRWDDDVIFKNQSRDDIEDKSKKRFINDMLRSDFHRKFMNKYMK
jgi:protein CWC15